MSERGDMTEGGSVTTSRLRRVADAFTGVADTFGEQTDPLALAARLVGSCVLLTDANTAGLMLASARGRLRTVAVSDGRAEWLEMLQTQTDEGPCADSWRTGHAVKAPRLAACTDRWPHFTAMAAALGVGGAYAVPVLVGDAPVGTLNLLMDGDEGLPEDDLALVSSLSRVAAGSMLRWRAEAPRPYDILTRVQSVISAKASVDTALGMLAADDGLSIPDAARALEEYARRAGVRPARAAQRLLERDLTPREVLAAAVMPPGGAPTG
jgi:hypothetical protein